MSPAQEPAQEPRSAAPLPLAAARPTRNTPDGRHPGWRGRTPTGSYVPPRPDLRPAQPHGFPARQRSPDQRARPPPAPA